MFEKIIKKFKDCPTWDRFLEEWKAHYGVSFGGPMAKAVWDQILERREK